MQPNTSTTLTAPANRPLRRLVNLVVIHCTATPSGKPLGQGEPGKANYLNAPQVINAWHAARGFKRAPEAVQALSTRLPNIGYHYIVDLTGEVWTGRGPDEVGAHAAHFNAHSVGICLVGGAERDAQYTAAQWRSLKEVVAMLLAECGIPCTAPKRIPHAASPVGYSMVGGVCGHRDLSPDTNGSGLVEPFEWLKTCPGFDVRAWLARGMQPLQTQVCEISQFRKTTHTPNGSTT